MEISELVGIGKLGKQEADGFYHVRLSQSYKSILTRLRDCFLIFSSNRVFYVTVVETKSFGKHNYLRFWEDGIAEECKKTVDATLALTQEDLNALENDDEIKNLIEYEIYYLNQKLGKLVDVMYNSMQRVFIIELDDGKELMVPHVPYYVSSTDDALMIIHLQNLDELLEICTSMS